MTTNTEIMEELKTLRSCFQDYQLMAHKLDTRLCEIEGDTLHLKNIIDGNGRDGLKTEIIIMKRHFDQRSKREWGIIIIGIGIILESVYRFFVSIF